MVSGKAQLFPQVNPEVVIDGRTRINGFAGGVGCPQISEMDIDRDGITDMFVFDRYGARVIPLVARQEGQRINYVYAPEYLERFPRLADWALVRDYNKDGLPDIFASSSRNQGPFGIEVYTGQPDGSFELMRAPGETYDILYFPNSSGRNINIYVAADDLPAIVDMDGDGDLDILTFEPLGSVMYYFRNVAVEEGLGLNTLKYVLEDDCWGKFYELESSEEVELSNDPNTCAFGFKEDPSQEGGGVHAGSTVLTFDQDKDGDQDLLIGDLTNTHMGFLRNGGTPTEGWINEQIPQWPDYDQIIEMEVFNAAFLYDVNKDGQKDLIAAPNTPFSEDYSSQWYYIGFEVNGEQLFSLEQTDFLSEKMIDLGSGCRPFIVDYNADGLQDIIVGNDYYYNPGAILESRLMVFENTGTPTSPTFELVDEDYLGLSRFSGGSTADNLWSFTPAFGDIDGDGDMDCVVGSVNGEVIFLENTAGAGSPFAFANPIVSYMGIDVGGNSVPFIYDVNEDGLGDLIIGQKTNNNDQNGDGCGSIHYFQNIGRQGNPMFASDVFAPSNDPCFGRQVFFQFGSAVFSSPYVADLNGTPRLYVGTNQGIKVLDNISAINGAVFDLSDENLGNLYTDEMFHVALGDLDGDDGLEMIVGHVTGGMTIHKTDHRLDGSVSTKEVNASQWIEVWPNPSSGVYQVILEGPAEYAVYDLDGQLVSMGQTYGEIDIQEYPKGVYLLSLQISGELRHAKLVKN